jgi:WD40 repeat protein
MAGYRYRAFISYRHVPNDRRWARWLMTSLETFRTPYSLIRRGVASRVGRLYRDDDEVSASSNLLSHIEEALRASEYLIVVCSLGTPASDWVRLEVEYFQSLGRAERILCLLIEGTPAASFPLTLLKSNDPHPDWDTRSSQIAQPAAGDVRPRPDESVRATERRALLRIAARLLGSDYDDLARRYHRRTVHRRWIAGASAAAALLAAWAGLFAWDLQRGRALQLRDDAMVEASVKATADGDPARGLALALQALPDDVDHPDRPVPLSALAAILNAFSQPRLLEVVPELPDAIIAGKDRSREMAFVDDDQIRLTAGRGGSQVSRQIAIPPPPSSGETEPPELIYAALTDDGSRALALWEDGRLAVTDASRNVVSETLGGRDAQYSVFDLTPDRRFALVESSRAGYDLQGALIPVARPGRAGGHASLSMANRVGLIDVGTQRRTVSFAGTGGALYAAAFSPDGAYLATASQDGMVRLWKTSTGQLVAALPPRREMTRRLAFRGPYLITTSAEEDTRGLAIPADKALFVWDAKTGRRIGELGPGLPAICSFDVSPDGRVLATGHTDGSVRVFDVASAKPVADLIGHQAIQSRGVRRAEVEDVKFSPNGALVAAAGVDGKTLVWQTPDRTLDGISPDRDALQPEYVLQNGKLDPAGIPMYGYSLVTERYGGRERHDVLEFLDKGILGVRGKDLEFRVWGLWQRRAAPPAAPAVVQKASSGYSASIDGKRVAVIDDASGRKRFSVEVPDGPEEYVSVSKDGTRLATPSRVGALYLWGESGNLIATLVPARTDVARPIPDAPILFEYDPRHSIAGLPRAHQDGFHLGPLARFDGSGKFLLSAYPYPDRSVTIWRAATAERLGSFVRPTDTDMSGPFDVSPDERRILTTTGFETTGVAQLWDLHGQKLIADLVPPPEFALVSIWAGFSPDGRLAATLLSNDNAIRFWDAGTGKPLGEVSSSSEEIPRFAQGGQVVVWGGDRFITPAACRILIGAAREELSAAGMAGSRKNTDLGKDDQGSAFYERIRPLFGWSFWGPEAKCE